MVFISTLLSSSLGSRFSNTLESHQIDDDYSGQYDFDTVELSSSSLPQSQRQVSSTNLSSGLLSYPDRRVITETTAATATINASNFSSPPSPPRQSLASTPTQPSNCVAVADIDTRFPPSSAVINQYDPYEEVPSYEASQRMHNQSANSNSNNNNNSSSNIAHNNDNYIAEDVSHIAPTTHIYTPIPSLPIPITSSTTGISYGNSTMHLLTITTTTTTMAILVIATTITVMGTTAVMVMHLILHYEVGISNGHPLNS